jgi:uncharacterized radical SAM superfamily protein
VKDRTPDASAFNFAFRLKLHTLTRGVRLHPDVVRLLSDDGARPLTVHEYATTGGVTLRWDDIYVNAPFDDWYCDQSRALVALTDNQLVVRFDGHEQPVEVLPLPGYLGTTNARGESTTATTMSHCDRIRVSPIMGCTLDCRFCDLPALKYREHPSDELLSSIDVAKADHALPPHHLLVSGGSPGKGRFAWFDQTVVDIASRCGLPTDVMMSPREGDLDYLARYVDAGVTGFSFNLEVYGDEPALAIMPRKHRRSTPHFERTATAAVELLGAGTGAVRSIVIVGLDDLDTTVEAIELIAGLGLDPVLSPFRPAQGTALEASSPPDESFLLEVWGAANEIAAKHDVALGPRCIPCQHNILALPWGPAYSYSADGNVHGGAA